MPHTKRKECLFRSFLIEILIIDDVIEEWFRKIENEELLRIFPISMVTQLYMVNNLVKVEVKLIALHNRWSC